MQLIDEAVSPGASNTPHTSMSYGLRIGVLKVREFILPLITHTRTHHYRQKELQTGIIVTG